MLQLDAGALAARLDRRALIEALDGAFRKSCTVPMRQQYQLAPAAPDRSAGTLLVMPAWTPGGALGIKLVTVFPDNALQGLAGERELRPVRRHQWATARAARRW